jgi:hypothetical protein
MALVMVVLVVVVVVVGLLLPTNAQAATIVPLMDANVTVNGHGTVTTPSFSTAEPGEQLLAFISSDGPSGAGRQSATVTGAGLTLDARQARELTVRRGRDLVRDGPQCAGRRNRHLDPGRRRLRSVADGDLDGALHRHRRVGHRRRRERGAERLAEHRRRRIARVRRRTRLGNAIARTLGPNQTMLHQYLDTATGDTSWSQYTGQATGLAGSVVMLNDTAPTSDQWNMAAVEVLGDGTAK